MFNTIKTLKSISTRKAYVLELINTELNLALECAGEPDSRDFASGLSFRSKEDWCYTYDQLSLCGHRIARSCERLICSEFNGEIDPGYVSPADVSLMDFYSSLFDHGDPSKQFEGHEDTLWFAKQCVTTCEDMQRLYGVFERLEDAVANRLDEYLIGVATQDVQEVEADKDIPSGDSWICSESGPVHEDLEEKIAEYRRIFFEVLELAREIRLNHLLSPTEYLADCPNKAIVLEFASEFADVDVTATMEYIRRSTPGEIESFNCNLNDQSGDVKSMISEYRKTTSVCNGASGGAIHDYREIYREAVEFAQRINLAIGQLCYNISDQATYEILDSFSKKYYGENVEHETFFVRFYNFEEITQKSLAIRHEIDDVSKLCSAEGVDFSDVQKLSQQENRPLHLTDESFLADFYEETFQSVISSGRLSPN